MGEKGKNGNGGQPPREPIVVGDVTSVGTTVGPTVTGPIGPTTTGETPGETPNGGEKGQN